MLNELKQAREKRPEHLPLSYGQQRLWFLDRLEGVSPEYNMPEALRLRGQLDRVALEEAINTIVKRHESLRTHFVEVDGKPEQLIEPTLQIEIPVEDLSGLGESEQRERVMIELRREGAQAFDLGRGPVLRVKLLKLGDQEHILSRTMHHIASDAWSTGVFNRELKLLYEAYREGQPDPLKPLSMQYADFAVWQRSWLDGGALDEGLKYWKDQLAEIPERLELPTDRPRPAVQTFRAEVYQVELSAEQTAGLKRLGQENRTTLYMTLLAVFGALLSRYSGQDDIVVGSPIANRQDAQLEEMIGFFVNTLVMRIAVRKGMSFRELLKEVREMALEAYRHQDVPFERLVEELSPERNLNRIPLCQVLFSVQNAPWVPQQLKGLQVEAVSEGERVRFDLEVHAFERNGRTWFRWLYNCDLFDRWRIEQMAQHYARILQAVVADTEQAVDGIDLLSVEERQRILKEWNDTDADYPSEKCLHELFEEQVERAPEAVALVSEAQQITYAQLNKRANRLAHYLMKMGIGPDSVVAVAIPRSVEMVVSLLGILKAGAAYLPLDPEYPTERLSLVVNDSKPACVLAGYEVGARLSQTTQVISFDEPGVGATLERCPANNPTNKERATPLLPQHPVYVIYTSGSTGKPKGVIVGHQSLTNYILWASHEYASTGGLGAPVNTPLMFDATVTSLFLPLIGGQRVILLPEDRQIDILAELLESGAQLTLIKLTPAHLAALQLLLHSRSFAIRTRLFVVGGEALKGTVAKCWRDIAPTLRIVNEYGPTETVVGCCFYQVSQETNLNGDVPIGRPIWNVRVYVLDRQIQAVPVGVVGELYIAGSGLAQCYLNQAALTAERFVADPFGAAGTRMYRTGDLVRWQVDGNLEFLGRNDDQVKIRGFRIELGEIESALRTCETVIEAIVVAREDEPGEKRLVAYVVTSAGQSIDTNLLRQQLSQILPEYMMPSAIVTLNSLPLTPNGKVDRKSLPEARSVSKVYQAPRTPEEKTLCVLFAEVLGVNRVGIDDNFFELGGHSLMAMQLVSRIRREMSLEISVRTLFQARCVRQLSAAIRAWLFSASETTNESFAVDYFEEEQL